MFATGCEAHATFQSGDTAQAGTRWTLLPVVVLEDSARGVTCYAWHRDPLLATAALSCVKVRP